jgi:hypothetical protein
MPRVQGRATKGHALWFATVALAKRSHGITLTNKGVTVIPVEYFISPAEGSQEYHAVKKALDRDPPVKEIWQEGSFEFFLVQGTQADSVYVVRLYRDADGQQFAQCECPAGNPPVDNKTRLPVHVPVPCYHVGAVLIFMAKKD